MSKTDSDISGGSVVWLGGVGDGARNAATAGMEGSVVVA
jgi:hypothetical protein